METGDSGSQGSDVATLLGSLPGSPRSSDSSGGDTDKSESKLSGIVSHESSLISQANSPGGTSSEPTPAPSSDGGEAADATQEGRGAERERGRPPAADHPKEPVATVIVAHRLD